VIDRTRAVETLAAEEFDAVVIGGGLTGAGVALDAAARGLSVALVERHDFASGMSSRSSKLLHGEPAHERDVMLALAPRLVRPLGLVLPGGRQTTPAAVVDDARLVLTLIGEADRRGAVCANRLEAVEVVERDARITGVRLHDHERDGGFTVATAAVIDATGAPATARRRRVAHILLAADRLPLNGSAVTMPRGAFALPWLGRVVAGPADSEHLGEPDEARPLERDIQQLLAVVNSHFGTALEEDAVVAATCGLRVARPELHTSDSGVVTVTGSELTSWRLLAKRCVDVLLERDGRVAPCRTHRLELAPGHGPPSPDPIRAHLIARYGAQAGEVLRLAVACPHGGEPIVPGLPDLFAEATYAACSEQARSVGDVLLRRTRVGLLAAREACDPRSTVGLRVAQAMAPALGWTDRRIEAEVVAWRREAQAEGLVPAS
jgi:glycerol-3-phosphate dehydrogenase